MIRRLLLFTLVLFVLSAGVAHAIRWPVDENQGDSTKLTSDFGPGRGSDEISRMHAGIDIHAANFTPVFAAVDGEVVDRYNSGIVKDMN